MTKHKLKQTFFVSIFVSLGAQIYMDVFIEGFIVGLSVAMLAVFLYCYEDLQPALIAVLAGLFSPLFRLLYLVLQGESPDGAAKMAIPDMVFFAWYGLIYCLIFQVFKLCEKNIRTFPIIIAVCDFSANLVEILVRQILYDTAILDLRIIKYLIMVALIRTLLVEVILLAIHSYSSLVLRKEHDEEYQRLMVLTSIFESEVYLMNKNAEGIERIMKQAFTLYKDMDGLDIPPKFKEISLDISKDAHEIKNDYLRTIAALKDTFITDQERDFMEARDLIQILKADIQNQIRAQHKKIDFVVRVKDSFAVERHFDFMSVLRNLVINSMEAIGDAKGKIELTIFDEDQAHVILVRDNGPGIDEKNLAYIFSPGFSTKFHADTGDISRGVGLSLVQDYVEESLQGTISVESEKGCYTEFRITIPKTKEVKQ